MLPVSSLYKQFVYTTEYARHFIPEVILKIVDLPARESCSYVVSAMVPFSNRVQLIDDIFGSGSGCYGTCEVNQFILDGNHDTFSDQDTTEGSVGAQIGVISDILSDSAGAFNPPLVVTCNYTQDITTVGRALFFNETEEAVPADFDIAYYKDATLLKTVEVRNNSEYVYNDIAGISNYNKVVFTFTRMTVPFARVKLIEDIPGLYIVYREGDVISMNYTATADLFSTELLTGEVDVALRNDQKLFDMFNSEGFEAYLQRRQPLEIYLTMVFPDNTQEKIKVGTMFTTEWKTKSSTLEAYLTARDMLDKLYQDEYDKGVYTPTPVSFYNMAEAIFIDAGIEKYTIDSALQNIYTYGIPPVATHKEVLRYIAQASCSVLLPTVDGGVKLKYIGVPSGWYNAVDELDYSILIDSPDIYLDDAVKSVAVAQYTYTLEVDASEIYNEVKTINGTETFDATYTYRSAECSATITPATGVTATIDSITYYANIAKVTITATGEFTLTISGKKVVETQTITTIDSTLDTRLVPDAKKVSIDNPFVTTSGVATNLLNYSAYWYTRRYRYVFDWRQNPAIELLDPVVVHDDYAKDNVTLIYEQNLDFQGGSLGGSSKALY